eukprot:351033-Chlamydomonas_euryale.AAC.1
MLWRMRRPCIHPRVVGRAAAAGAPARERRRWRFRRGAEPAAAAVATRAVQGGAGATEMEIRAEDGAARGADCVRTAYMYAMCVAAVLTGTGTVIFALMPHIL